MLFIAIAVSLQFLLGPAYASAFAFGFRKGGIRTEIVVHKIKDCRLSFSHLVGIGDDIDLNDLMLYDDCFEDGSMLYLATRKNDTRVIGMVEVLPETVDELDAQELRDYVASDDISSVDVEFLERLEQARKGGEGFTFCGLRCEDVVTNERCRRNGVATTLFRAIEKDAFELVERMKMCGGKYCGPSDERIRLEVASVSRKAAMSFYRSIGFQFKPWQDGRVKKEQTYLQRLIDRLKWTWQWLNPKSGCHDLIKMVGNSTCSTT